jgi:predicted acylesterase/phospholipase RssA
MKKLISTEKILILFYIIFFPQTPIHPFSFDFQSLVPNFNFSSVKSYFLGESHVEKGRPFIMAEAQVGEKKSLTALQQYLYDETRKKLLGKEELEKKDDDEKKESISAQLWNVTKQDLNNLWQVVSYEKFKETYLKLYPEQTAGMRASIEKGQQLTSKGEIDPFQDYEGRFLSARLDKVQENIQKFLDYKITNKKEVPRIGIALSGGGYRAMILTAGYLKALEDLGLLDSALYIAALSGSTWYVGPWVYQQHTKTSISDFNQMLIEKIKKNHLDLLQDPRKDFNVEKFASQVIWPKVLFEQPIASIDIYGGALSHYLLADLADRRLTARLSAQHANVMQETMPTPFPIYTAVAEAAADDHNYDWYEFNPWRIWNLEHDCSFQSYAFGRKFKNGQSVQQQNNYPPEQSFGFLMGIFGSAFTVNLNDIVRILFGIDLKTEKDYPTKLAQWFGKSIDWAKKGIIQLPNYFNMAKKGDYIGIFNDVKDNLLQIQGTIFLSFLQIVSDIVIKKATDKTIMIGNKEIIVGSTRFVPAQVYNPFNGYEGVDEKLQEQEVLTFVDAGIDYNIPLRPLLRPERDLDLIIIGDASGDVPKGTGELQKALADIKRVYDIDYTKDAAMSSKTMMVYRPQQKSYSYAQQKKLAHVEPPILVYFNYLKDDALIKEAEKSPELNTIVKENNLAAFSENCLIGYCSTFNFNYSVEEFKQLSGIGELNIRAHEKDLKKLVGQARARAVEEEGFGG